MEHVCSSRKDECLFIDHPNTENFHEILNSNLEQEESPLFSGFPSPFFDDISTSAPNKPLNIITKPLPSESKRLIKKRSVGKKDRHSKIHTAQGLRDRRMRLSLHIARKFFDLQDLLGFDKASNTIEWLFSKSNKAIKEVALQNFDHPQLLHPNPNNKNNNQSTSQETICEVLQGLTSEIKSAINKPRENPKKEIKNNKDLRKQIPNNSSTRDQARARARDRTRERQMIKELEKSKQLFGENTKDEIYKLGLRSPNNHNVEELGFTSSPLESSPSLEYSSSTANLLQEIQATIDVNSFENYSGSIYNVGGTSTSTYLINHHNPPAAGWLNSTNVGLLGTPGDWEAADRFVGECCNYEIEPTFAADHDPLTAGDIYDQQNHPSAFFM